MPMAESCPVCGTPMLHFRNPDRLLCPRPGLHQKIYYVIFGRGPKGKSHKKGE